MNYAGPRGDHHRRAMDEIRDVACHWHLTRFCISTRTKGRPDIWTLFALFQRLRRKCNYLSTRDRTGKCRSNSLGVLVVGGNDMHSAILNEAALQPAREVEQGCSAAGGGLAPLIVINQTQRHHAESQLRLSHVAQTRPRASRPLPIQYRLNAGRVSCDPRPLERSALLIPQAHQESNRSVDRMGICA
jgi:hypothetical protein